MEPGDQIQLTVFTVCDRLYEPFALPFIASTLHHNSDAVVELAVQDPDALKATLSPALDLLRSSYGDRVVFSATRPDLAKFNSQRFLLTPTHRNPYVYISDCDILCLERISPQHLARMAQTGRRYSNIVRPGKKALSGLHFSEWDALYPLPLPRPDIPLGYDESLLYGLVEDRGNPMPSPDDTWRPVHGFHLSLNRNPATGWTVTNNRHVPAYCAFTSDETWRELLPLLAPKMLALLSVLDGLLSVAHPEAFSDPPTVIKPRQWWTRL